MRGFAGFFEEGGSGGEGAEGEGEAGGFGFGDEGGQKPGAHCWRWELVGVFGVGDGRVALGFFGRGV